MGNDLSDAVYMAVDLFLLGLLLTSVSILMQQSALMGSYLNQRESAIAVVQEWRVWNQYDNTEVYPQDVINLIFETRGMPEVWVDIDNTVVDNFAYKWTTTSAPCNYTAVDLSNLLPVSGPYTSKLVKDLNGAILRVEFRRG